MPTVVFNPQKEINDLRAEIAQLREDLKVQSNAVWILDQCRRAEVSHLRKTHQQAETAAKTLDSEREANSLLTAENERLRENLRDIIEAWDWWQVDTYDRCQSVPSDAIRVARAALAEKENNS